MTDATSVQASGGIDIAIVGMAGRFPGADNVDALWRNIMGGTESVSVFSDEKLRERGISQSLLDDPGYVKAGVQFDGFDQFDASFFGYSPREAEQLDPQHRLLLECAWEAIESAGYDVSQIRFPVGIYAGAGPNLYLMRHLLPRLDWERGSGIAELMGLMNGNAMGALCTQVAYKLNLRGPAVTVHTACSTSLVAVHVACQSLLGQECDMALAGGVWLNLLQDRGYLHQPGAILSSDGHCRAFDAAADGTALGSGVGIVVLKRLDDALRDRDFIHAVIKGTAANNDGANKVGYTAPSVDAQAEVIETAHLVAGVEPETIGYVEAHGTGTTLGDPIEVAALTQAFRKGTARSGYCALGSVKTNIGHLDAAAGVTGLIKTALALRDGVLPSSLNYSTPNPQIDFEHSPFYVNTQPAAWPAGSAPRRAGVSSFGIGGTNVHAVLEASPDTGVAPAAVHPEAWLVLPVSAASEPALKDVIDRLAEHLQSHPDQSLSDVAHTLQVGRQALPFRGTVVAKNHADAVEALNQLGAARVKSTPDMAPEVVFLFPGAGSQHAGMGVALYEAFPQFRVDVDHCLDFLGRECDLDLRPQIFPVAGAEHEANRTLARMEFGQTAQFVVSYATARLWMSLGVKPVAMLGHSLGEYVAACVAGVFSLDDALRVVVERARLQQKQGLGAMTSVLLSESELQPFLGDGCELSVINGEQMSVLSGPVARLKAVEQALTAQGHVPHRLHVAVAAHSAMTEPIMGALENLVAGVPRRAPQIPFVSNVSGRLIAADEATSPAYWAKHLRSTVRFLDGLNTLLAAPGRVVLEVGSGDALTSVARQHGMASSVAAILSSQAHARQYAQNVQQFASAAGGLWATGVPVDWSAIAGGQPRRRVPLPTYPFQRRRYWIEPDAHMRGERETGGVGRGVAKSLYVPVWKRAALNKRPPLAGADDGCVVLLAGAGGLPVALATVLRAKRRRVVIVERGARFEKVASDRFTLPTADRDGFLTLLRAVEGEAGPVGSLIHLWSLDTDGTQVGEPEELERGFFSLLACAQAMEAQYDSGTERQISLAVVTNQLEDVLGDEPLYAAKATLRGLAKVIGQEYPQIVPRVVDILLPVAGSREDAALCERVAAELQGMPDDPVVAYRHGHRWIKDFEVLQQDATARPRLRVQGVYLITGGLGGVGLALAKHLARHWRARLVLVGRTPMPERTAWAELVRDSRQPHALRYRLQQLLDLEEMGASVLVVHADVADADRLKDVVAQAHSQFGAIQGVVHAAGDPGSGMLSSRTRSAVEGVFASKIRGTEALLNAVAKEPLEFILFCSSISAVAGGLGMGDYAAANAYLDGVAVALRRTASFPIFSVDWDAWRELGMAAGMKVPEGVGWNAEEGAKAFEYIVCGPDQPHIVVCTTDLTTRLARLEDGVLQAIEASSSDGTGALHPRPPMQTEYVAPEGELEAKLTALWSEILGVSPVGANDSLFELGGDSLLAIQLMSRIRTVTGIHVHVSELFRHPTPREFAALLQGREKSKSVGMDFVAAKADRGELVPLSYAQQRLWFLWKLSPGGTAYNVAKAFRVAGGFEPQAMEYAVRQLVSRHAALRTLLRENAGVAHQLVLPSMEIDVPVLDMREGGISDVKQLSEYVNSRVRIPFDLEQGPLLRAEAIRIGNDEFVILMVMHHVATDGWSVAVMMNEFAELYAANRERRPPNLRQLEFSYADFAVAQRRWLEAGEMERQVSHWRNQVSGISPLKLPQEKVPPHERKHPVGVIDFRIDSESSLTLRSTAKARSVTPYIVLLCATAIVLSERSGQRKFYVGSDMANRNRVEAESMVGFFVNQVPLRIDLEAPQSVGQLLDQLQETVVNAADFQDLPFDRLVEALRKSKRAGRAPLFQIKIIYQEDNGAAFSLPGMNVSEYPVGQFEAELDLIISFLATDRDIRVEMTYDQELFHADTMESIRQDLLWVLEQVLAETEQSIRAISESLFLRRRSEWARKAADRADRMSEMRSGLRRHNALPN